MKQLSTYICESKTKISNKNIERIKQFLISKYHVNTWEECIDKQVYGTCREICKLIVKEFPNVFDRYALDIYCDFSDIAIKLINDDEEPCGNHYVLTKGKTIYDFARGANCINGIYVLTQMEDNSDKYDIVFTDAEKELINITVKRNLNN